MFKGPITDDEELAHLHRFLQGLGSIELDPKAVRGERPDSPIGKCVEPGAEVLPAVGGDEVKNQTAVSGSDAKVSEDHKGGTAKGQQEKAPPGGCPLSSSEQPSTTAGSRGQRKRLVKKRRLQQKKEFVLTVHKQKELARSKKKSLPTPSSEWSCRRPPIRVTRPWQTASPMPVP